MSLYDRVHHELDAHPESDSGLYNRMHPEARWKLCPVCSASYLPTYEEHTGSRQHREAVARANGLVSPWVRRAFANQRH